MPGISFLYRGAPPWRCLIAGSPLSAFAQTNVQPSRNAAQTTTDPDRDDNSGSHSHGACNDTRHGGSPAAPAASIFRWWALAASRRNVKAVSKAAKYYLENCHCPTASCIADVLDRYADALDALGPQLPPQVADLPAIVRRSARKLRAARSLVAGARRGQRRDRYDHAKLKLLTVADPDARDEGVRSARYVADTLNVAEVSLTRVSGL